jgi:glycine cleavage system H protein
MSAVLEVVQAIGSIALVLVARLGLFLAAAALLVAPVALWVVAARSWRSLRARLRGVQRIGGVHFRKDVRYAPGHTWIERQGGLARVGADGVAQQILPWALGVELPSPGEMLTEGQTAAVISCGDVEARLASPLAGRVVAVNTALLEDPSLVKEDGFGSGWLFAVEPADARWSTLASGEPARHWTRREADRLREFYRARLGPLWKNLLRRPAPMVAPEVWSELTREFLRA